MRQSKTLRDLLRSEETLVMPDAYDPISARIIERTGFQAVQCSGYSFSLAMCRAREADVGFDANLERTRRIIEAVRIPVMADGEDGFGDPDTVGQTVREFIQIGTAGINIEDQVLGEHEGVKIADEAVMVEKLHAAREAAQSEGNSDLVINARTDALKAFPNRADGLRTAIDRANRYLAEGADLAFICYAGTLEEVRTLVKEIDGPISIAAGLPYNIESFSIAELRQCGVARVSLPVLAIFSAIHAMAQTMQLLQKGDGFSEILDAALLCSGEELQRICQS